MCTHVGGISISRRIIGPFVHIQQSLLHISDIFNACYHGNWTQICSRVHHDSLFSCSLIKCPVLRSRRRWFVAPNRKRKKWSSKPSTLVLFDERAALDSHIQSLVTNLDIYERIWCFIWFKIQGRQKYAYSTGWNAHPCRSNLCWQRCWAINALLSASTTWQVMRMHRTHCLISSRWGKLRSPIQCVGYCLSR